MLFIAFWQRDGAEDRGRSFKSDERGAANSQGGPKQSLSC